MSGIINPLHKSWCRVLYIWCIAGWSIAKVLHDWLLLGGADEYTTLRIGCISIFFQLMAVSLAFFWSMGAVEVFVAEIVPGKCACYYVLPELEAILAIGTPFLLFLHAVKKLENVHRAPLVGDYLYYQQQLFWNQAFGKSQGMTRHDIHVVASIECSWMSSMNLHGVFIFHWNCSFLPLFRAVRYDLPFRLALKSGAVDSSTCLIGTAHGYHREEWQDQLAVWQLRVLHTVHLVLSYVLFLGVAHLQTEASVVGVWYLVYPSVRIVHMQKPS